MTVLETFAITPDQYRQAVDPLASMILNYVPGDGDVAEGIAPVDESAITGESAAVIRESGAAGCQREARSR